MFQVDLLFARYEGDGDIGLGLKIEVPEGSGVFGVFVELGAGEWTLAPDNAGDIGGELSNICMGDHTPNIMPYDMDRLFDAHMLRHQFVEILSEHILGVAIRRVGRVPSTTVVWSYNSVAGFSERDGDMAELIRCLWEAVNEENGTLRLARGWKTFDVVDTDLRVGLLKPDLAVVGNGVV